MKTAEVPGSAWSPFHHTVFTVLWVATVVSNIGSWMQSAAAGWLMTTLSPEPLNVALVQAVTTLPMFLFSLLPEHWPTSSTVAAAERAAFLTAMTKLAGERRRDGAFDWGIYEDASKEGVFVEAFCVGSWLEHMRQHQRITNADRVLQDAVHRFHDGGDPAVRHLIAARGERTGMIAYGPISFLR